MNKYFIVIKNCANLIIAIITIGYSKQVHTIPFECEINYINYCVIYLTFEEKFDKMKKFDNNWKPFLKRIGITKEHDI